MTVFVVQGRVEVSVACRGSSLNALFFAVLGVLDKLLALLVDVLCGLDSPPVELLQDRLPLGCR